MLWSTVAGERLVVTASGRVIEVGVGTAVGSLWFPVGTFIGAGCGDLEIISPISVACRPHKFQRSQHSLIICKASKARAGWWLGQRGVESRRPDCVNHRNQTFGELVF
jgi:hypothetical protein